MTKSQALKLFTTRKTNYARKFRYTGNIAHIKSYIDVNMRANSDCIVEIFVRPLNHGEREIYGKPEFLPKVLQDLKPKRSGSSRSRAASRNKVEKKPKDLLRAS